MERKNAGDQRSEANKTKETENMKMKRTKKALSLFLCMVLIVAMALFTTGCNDREAKETTAAVTVTQTEAAVQETAGGAGDRKRCSIDCGPNGGKRSNCTW